jgi:hypothetical protein
MSRARCAQGACAFGISGNGAALLPIERGPTCGNKNSQACDAPLRIETANFAVRLHLSQSKVRRSKPGSVGSMLESLIGLRHLAHGITPISAALNDGSDCAEGMCFPCVWAGACSTLSHREAIRRTDDVN